MGRNYQDLVAWQRADDLAVAIYQATLVFPREETYRLRSQIRRAAVSVPANIAEGSGKRTTQDRRASFDNSMSELNELEYFIHLSRRLGYFDAETASRLEVLRADVARPLDGLLKMLDKQIQSRNT